MFAERKSVTLTTNADGDATGYIDGVTGRIINLIYTKDDFADGVDFTVTLEATGQSVWAETNVNASAVRAPRQLTYTTAGASITYADTFGVYDFIVAADDRIKVVVASGGDTKSGTITAIIA